MPTRSLRQSVQRWPSQDRVLADVRAWLAEQTAQRPSLQRAGLFGSYGRGDAGFGSDLDLLLIDRDAAGPQHRRLLVWPLERLPLCCDALVLTPDEWEQLQVSDNRMASELRRDLLWLL